MKYLHVLLLLLMAYSCSDESNIEQEKQAVKPVDTEQRPPQPTTTIQSTTTEPVQHESVFPPGKYKTLKDLMNNCFSTGSTRSEVRRVQGEPDYTEANLPLENWYYGRCVVQFKGQLVGGVSNPDGSLKYADYFELALSPDKTESEFYLLINSRINR